MRLGWKPHAVKHVDREASSLSLTGKLLTTAKNFWHKLLKMSDSEQPTQKKHKGEETVSEGILFGLGNPLLDISTTVTQDFLDKYNLKADNAILAEDIHKPMYDEIVKEFEVDYIPGGATQNSLRVAQWIIGKPNRATFFGCVGKDDFAKTLLEKAKKDGVNVNYDINEKEATGTCAVLITGSNRSLCANLAAANCYTIEHLEKPENWAYVEKASFYYSAGFHLTVNPKAMLKIAKHSFENKKTYCLNLSAPFLSQFFRDPMMEILPYVDFLFGNETEAHQFAKDQNYETEDLKEIVKKIAAEKKISEQARVVVITQGADSTLVCKDGQLKEYPVIKIADEDIVDTNGAGDAFVGGFLAQLIQGKDVDQCIKCANYTANYVIKQSGTSINGKPDFE